jgi:hypothetical protein
MQLGMSSAILEVAKSMFLPRMAHMGNSPFLTPFLHFVARAPIQVLIDMLYGSAGESFDKRDCAAMRSGKYKLVRTEIVFSH